MWPTLTTVRQPITRMADSATRALIRTLRGEEDVAPDAPFHCELVIRNSSIAP